MNTKKTRRRATESDLDAAFIELVRGGRRAVDWRMLYAKVYGRGPRGADRRFIALVARWARKRGLDAVRHRNRNYYH